MSRLRSVVKRSQERTSCKESTVPNSMSSPRPLWIRDPVPLIPQTWSCAVCEWFGDSPRWFYEGMDGNPVTQPICPECGEHRFYIFDGEKPSDFEV